MIRYQLGVIAAVLCLHQLDAATKEVPPVEGWIPPEIHCPAGQAPMLDGRVAAEEWSDALIVRRVNDPWPHDTQVQKLNVTYPAADLGCAIHIKHDAKHLYVLAEVTDDLIYKLDSEEWIPGKFADRGRPAWKSPPGQEDWGYWGDCFEIGLCANIAGPYKFLPITGASDPAKPGECWKIQGNISYGRIMAGDAMQPWVASGALRCAMQRREDPKGYVQEWAIALDPCLTVGDGTCVRPGAEQPIGMQLILVDVDTPESASGHLHPLINHQGVWPYNGRGPKKSRVNWAKLFLEAPLSPHATERKP